MLAVGSHPSPQQIYNRISKYGGELIPSFIDEEPSVSPSGAVIDSMTDSQYGEYEEIMRDHRPHDFLNDYSVYETKMILKRIQKNQKFITNGQVLLSKRF